MRRVLTEAAQAAVKAKRSRFQVVFRHRLPRGYKQALWAIAHRLCGMVWKISHDGVRYGEQGAYGDPKTRKTARSGPGRSPAQTRQQRPDNTQGASYRRSPTGGLISDGAAKDLLFFSFSEESCRVSDLEWRPPDKR